jgi:hypothetical protein
MTMKITKARLREIILEELQTETGIQENDSDNVFAPNHYCIHHGGVEHDGRIEMAEAVQHVVPDADGYISHYDMRLASGVILEDVAAEDIQVTNASLAEAHHGARDDDEDEEGHAKMKPKPDDKDELEELARATPGSDHRDRMEKRKEDARKRKEKEAKKDQQSEGLEGLKALIAQELKNLL